MHIKHIKVKNFKSFKEVDVPLGRLNVIIGANASGKSNFIQIFRFLRDLVRYDLDDAISLQGGSEYFKNIKLEKETFFNFQIKFREKGVLITDASKEKKQKNKKSREYRIERNIDVDYTLNVACGDRSSIEGERIVISGKEYGFPDHKRRDWGVKISKDAMGNIEISFRKKKENLSDYLKLLEILENKRKKEGRNFHKKFALLGLSYPHIPLLVPMFIKSIQDIVIFDFEPKHVKKAIPLSSKAELNEAGDNLPIILRNIISNNEKRAKLIGLVRNILPFVDDIEVEKVYGENFLLKVKEEYAQHYIPSNLLSDGTIGLVSVIVALYFDKRSLLFFEEPDKSLHPSLIEDMVEMMKLASTKKQIFVTTHNPELIKYVGVENLILVSRNEEGFSTITRPSNSEMVKIFLSNEIGLGDLHIRNLLGA